MNEFGRALLHSRRFACMTRFDGGPCQESVSAEELLLAGDMQDLQQGKNRGGRYRDPGVKRLAREKNLKVS